MSFKLDLSKFQKVASDKDCTTMRHEDGHEMKIAHSALSKGNRKQIEAIPMADGGSVKPLIDPEKAKAFVKGFNNATAPKPKDMASNVKHAFGFADGGMASKKGPWVDPKKTKEFVKGATDTGWQPEEWKKNLKAGLGMAEGGVAEDPSAVSTPVPMPPGYESSNPSPKPEGDGGESFLSRLSQGVDAVKGGFNSLVDGLGAGAKGESIDSIGKQPDAAGVQAPSQMTATTPLQVTSPAEIPAQTPVQGVEHAITGREGTLDDSLHKQMAGIAQQAKAEGSLGRKEADILNDQAIQQQEAKSHFDTQVSQNLSEREALQKDIAEGHIDPNHFVGNLSTVGKISTAISLIAGGIGAGLTHGDNLAGKYLDQQIHNDIEAQRANLGKKENLLSANMKQYGNLKDAYEMTRMQMADTVSTQLKAAAAQAQDPLAKARLLQQSGQIEQQIAPLQQTFAMNRAMVSAAAQDSKNGSGTGAQEAMLPYLRVINPEKAKEIETRLVPGVGMASVPVPSEARTKIIATNNLLSATKNLRAWSQKNGSSLDPKVRAEGATLAAELQQIYRQSVGASTSESEAHTIESIINSNPANVLHKFNSDPKLKALEHSMTNSMNNLKKGYGLPQQDKSAGLSPQQQKLYALAKAHPEHPKSAMILKKLGLDQ